MKTEILYHIFKQCTGVTTDSRHCPEGSMFIALRGGNFDGNAFAYYDINRHEFRIEPGEFTISVGASSRDIRLKDTIYINH